MLNSVQDGINLEACNLSQEIMQAATVPDRILACSLTNQFQA